MTRVIVTILVALAVLLPAAEHAAAAWTAGPEAALMHAPHTPLRGVRLGAVTTAETETLSIAPLPAAGAVSAPAVLARPSRPLAAPFVPPRG